MASEVKERELVTTIDTGSVVVVFPNPVVKDDVQGVVWQFEQAREKNIALKQQLTAALAAKEEAEHWRDNYDMAAGIINDFFKEADDGITKLVTEHCGVDASSLDGRNFDGSQIWTVGVKLAVIGDMFTALRQRAETAEQRATTAENRCKDACAQLELIATNQHPQYVMRDGLVIFEQDSTKRSVRDGDFLMTEAGGMCKVPLWWGDDGMFYRRLEAPAATVKESFAETCARQFREQLADPAPPVSEQEGERAKYSAAHITGKALSLQLFRGNGEAWDIDDAEGLTVACFREKPLCDRVLAYLNGTSPEHRHIEQQHAKLKASAETAREQAAANAQLRAEVERLRKDRDRLAGIIGEAQREVDDKVISDVAEQLDAEIAPAPAEASEGSKAASVTPDKYRRTIHEIGGTGRTIEVDVYCVLDAFPTNSKAVDHAVKKLLCAGERGHKDRATDLRESIGAIQRAIEDEVSLQPPAPAPAAEPLWAQDLELDAEAAAQVERVLSEPVKPIVRDAKPVPLGKPAPAAESAEIDQLRAANSDKRKWINYLARSINATPQCDPAAYEWSHVADEIIRTIRINESQLAAYKRDAERLQAELTRTHEALSRMTDVARGDTP